MATFAVGNPCTNVIVASTLEDAELVTGQTCYEYTEASPVSIGWVLDEATGVWSDPNVEVTDV